MKNHIMVDIETLGTSVDSVMLSISAVAFDIETGETDEEFEVFIDVDSCIRSGRKVTHDTLMWWFKESMQEARDGILQNKDNRIEVEEAVFNFNRFVGKVSGKAQKAPILWGNSNRFDLGIIAYGYPENEMTWNYWNERDVRTLMSLAHWFKDDEEFMGIAHYGIDDCKHQIKYVTKAWNYLKKGTR